MDYEKDQNSYDFEFEEEYKEDDFDPDNDPILNAFMEKLVEIKEKYDNIPKMRVPNMQKLAEFMKSYKLLVRIIRKDDKEAEIKFKLNDDFFDDGKPVVKITTWAFEISDIQNLKKILHNVENISASPKTSGGLTVYFGFNNIYDTYLEVQKTDSE